MVSICYHLRPLANRLTFIIGNFVSNYHWQDGIGSISERPKRIELAWLSDESNKFGTDEFIDYCRATAAEPYICLNSACLSSPCCAELTSAGSGHW